MGINGHLLAFTFKKNSPARWRARILMLYEQKSNKLKSNFTKPLFQTKYRQKLKIISSITIETNILLMGTSNNYLKRRIVRIESDNLIKL